FISRNKYRERNKQEFLNQLQHEFGDFYFLPEGGSNTLGAKGCSEILSGETDAFDEIVCPVGTGATLAGLIAVAKSHQHITGIALLNGKNYLEENVLQFLPAAVRCQWHIDHRFTLGGYGKTNETLTQFINSMRTLHNIPLDPVYSAKAFLALHQIAGEKSNEHKKFLFIHTGGYGINSFYKNNPR
ncbi:MAG TPA: 1-aminocyclopropane-1-carboxylate deaminase/D-cysteine desulfhydrase, partial [Bacteroidia bacterium]|nr:1-aminocyclopropane-1-carboxylate deaminase/D-cysteine desulfhydrase [Bacteroidia bacterium]